MSKLNDGIHYSHARLWGWAYGKEENWNYHSRESAVRGYAQAFAQANPKCASLVVGKDPVALIRILGIKVYGRPR